MDIGTLRQAVICYIDFELHPQGNEVTISEAFSEEGIRTIETIAESLSVDVGR